MANNDVHLITITGHPPSTDGSGNILYNLLQAFVPKNLTVVTNGEVVEKLSAQNKSLKLLDAPHLLVKPWRSNVRGLRRLLYKLSPVSNFLQIFPVTIKICRQVSKRTAILALPWAGELGAELFIAAYLAHLITKAPLIIYEHDDWKESSKKYSKWIERALERIFHRRIVKTASCVWTISQHMAEEFQKRYVVRTQVMPNSVDIKKFTCCQAADMSISRNRRIVFTGAVYGSQVGAIRNVLQAIQSNSDIKYTLVMYTNVTAEYLATQKISGDCLEVKKPVPVECMPETLILADILLLPFSFDEDEKTIVSTSLPTKTADYLASGVPILVHAPPYATISQLAREEGWAEVVDSTSQDELRKTLNRLAEDTDLRQRLHEKALYIAYQRHDIETRRVEFAESIYNAVLQP